MKWVSFRELRDYPKEKFSEMLREAAITIIADNNSSFCYSALEAMKSGSITMVKIPKNELDWANEEEQYPNCCVWFDDFDTLHQQIASVVRSWVTDQVPGVLAEKSKEITSKYTKDRTEKEFMDYVNSVLGVRKKEMEELILHVKSLNNE
jgi:hypothetical protein